MRHDVDVIVPVYNGHDAVARCLESVLAHTPGEHVRIVVADDASPDERIPALLAGFAARDPRVEVVRRAENLGFVGNCNAAMRDGRADVVLLNSDTEVPAGWLDRLQDAARSGGRVGSVTPLSNNATICSVPEWLVPNEYPDGVDLALLDEIAAATGTGAWMDIPTSVGFCVYLRRDALDAVGLFDQELFGAGYGEENDLACRMREAGYLNLLCDTLFVWHEGGVSFAESGTGDLSGNLQRITERWPGYHRVIQEFIAARSLWGVQARFGLDLMRRTKGESPRVLYLVHNRLWGAAIGGTEFHTMDLVETLGERIDPVILSFDDEGWATVQWRPGGTLLSYPLAASRVEEPAAWLERLLDTGVDLVHVQHPMRAPIPLLTDLLDRVEARDIPVVWTTHDYFGLCPSAQLLDHASGRSCTSLEGGPACDGCEQRAGMLSGLTVAEWRSAWRDLMDRAAVLVSPSGAAAGVITGAWPELGDRIRVIPHGMAPTDLPPPDPPGRGHAIAVLGYGGKHKGDAQLEELIGSLDDLDVTWHLFGRKRLGDVRRRDVVVHGNYGREALPGLLAGANVDLVLLLSPWAETYSYTLSEAWRQGIPVAGSHLGAIGERIADHGGGITIDPWDPAGTAAALRDLLARPERLEELRAQAATAGLALPSFADMAGEYEALYEALIGAGRGAAPEAFPVDPGEAEMRLWMGAFRSPLRV